LFNSLAIADAGWVNLKDIRLRYRTMDQLYRAGNPEFLTHTWPLWMVFGIDAWFRTVFLNARVTAVPGEQLAAQCV